jgi:hypothetical protein
VIELRKSKGGEALRVGAAPTDGLEYTEVSLDMVENVRVAVLEYTEVSLDMVEYFYIY